MTSSASLPSAPSLDRRSRARPSLARLLRRPEFGALAGTILVFVLFGLFAGDSGLFTLRGIRNFLQVSAELGILAATVSLLMIGGEFDLSLGSMIGLAGVTIAMGVKQFGLAIWMSVLIAFGFAIVVGTINGLLVIRTKLPSFIVTLAGLFVLRGLTLAVTRTVTGRTQIPYITRGSNEHFVIGLFGGDVFTGLFRWLAINGVIASRPDGAPVVPGIPVSVVWWFGLSALATWILLRTRLGNWTFACGGDANAARNIGVPVGRVKILLFIGTALSAALFASIQVLETGSADTLRGYQKEFEAIIAVVIGGTLLTGGYGSAIGAMFGALIFGTVEMGIFYTGIDTDWFQVFLGVMVCVAVLFNNFVRRKATEAR